MFTRMDVTSEEAVQNAFRQAVMQYGGVDVVVNNAGIAGGAPIEETSLRDWQRQVDILLTGYFLVAREAFKVMKAQGVGGTLVFVGSKNSVAAGKGAAAYSATKAGEVHLARCLAEEGGAIRSIQCADAMIQTAAFGTTTGKSRAQQYGRHKWPERFLCKHGTQGGNSAGRFSGGDCIPRGPRSSDTSGCHGDGGVRRMQ